MSDQHSRVQALRQMPTLYPPISRWSMTRAKHGSALIRPCPSLEPANKRLENVDNKETCFAGMGIR